MVLRNIGIFAHVDAGKTTLSEQLLLCAKAIRAAGSVDKGTAHTDTLPVERRRGISVKAACVRLSWKGCDINLIDTPGHTDFSAEIERALWAPDGAVLVISAAEGIQPQTTLLFEAMKSAGIPVIIFINKCDRDTADPERVKKEIRARLTPLAADAEDMTALTEAVAEQDEELLEQYLSGGTIAPETVLRRVPALVKARKLVPMLCGSALRGTGITALLDAVVGMLPPPGTDKAELCGIAFAQARDKALGKGLYIRMFGGTLTARDRIVTEGRFDPLTGARAQVENKISQIRDADLSDKGVLNAGEIGIVYGLTGLKVGQVIGSAELLPRICAPGRLRTPVMTVKALPEDPEDMQRLTAACMELSEEDPLLHARYVQATGELQLDVMGGIQSEILADILSERYGVRASFGAPGIIYRETIAKEAHGCCAYTMPKPCWAILDFIIRPAPRGSGVTFRSEVDGRDILPRYQHQVEQALPIALSQGRLGWKVTDVDITLVGGSHHQWHTHPLDFIVATPWGIQDGLRRGGSVLLEPVWEMRIHVPSECVGRIIADVNGMRGEIVSMHDDGEYTAVTALVPAAESMDYSVRLARTTSGRGSMSVSLHSYRDCPEGAAHTAPRRSVDPLDTAKYILAARNALESGIFDTDDPG